MSTRFKVVCFWVVFSLFALWAFVLPCAFSLWYVDCVGHIGGGKPDFQVRFVLPDVRYVWLFEGIVLRDDPPVRLPDGSTLWIMSPPFVGYVPFFELEF